MGYKRKERQAKKCGSGCRHNPKPTTERGKRRHAARSESEQRHAENAWNSGGYDR
jgi:hypothetical protein